MNRLLPLFLFVLAAPALADDAGFYSGTSLGQTHADNPTDFPLSKSTDTVFGGFLGWRFNQNIGIEGSYTGIGGYRNPTQSGKADALALDLVGFLPLGERFELVGKLGIADAIGKSARGGLKNDNRFAPTYGIGLQYNPTAAIGIRLGVDRYAASVKEGSTSHDYNADVVAATFVYRF